MDKALINNLYTGKSFMVLNCFDPKSKPLTKQNYIFLSY
ncbi:hypothetical protein P20311_2848 [Pseudoalteromonas sp. BSi20311]|nr:hypothetical protein P20311_2848 [Pseudoalteromonas sp. BSi20311]GAA73240.1 hypothetical protein P20439_3358 [Pseudoalteromonas sp. BSi20439]